jgi:hypothetical protein
MADQTKTPWTDPRLGDICEAGDGRVRKVLRVIYWSARHPYRHHDRRPGDWIDGVVYEAQGLARSCEGATWAKWCRVTVKAGGRYLRDGAEVGGRV